MKLVFTFLLLLIFSSVYAVTIDFENAARNITLSNQYQSQGVLFSGTCCLTGDVRYADYGVYDFGGYAMSLCYGGVGSVLTMKFVLASGENATTNSVSFRIGDGDTANESFQISMYTVANALLWQNTYTTYSGSVNGGVTINVALANIHRVEILGVGTGSGGSIDNLIFNATQPIPEPTTCLLSLVGLGLYLLKRKLA